LCTQNLNLKIIIPFGNPVCYPIFATLFQEGGNKEVNKMVRVWIPSLLMGKGKESQKDLKRNIPKIATHHRYC
jgi:hypothetical protein